MQRLFLINGLSTQALRYWQKNSRKILSSVPNCISVQTYSPESFKESVKKGLKSGFDQMIAVGGDGTIGLLTDTILKESNHRVVLGCLPAGTGCDFYRSISQGWSPRRLLTEGIDVKIDTLSVELDHTQPINAVNSLSIGISADIVAGRDKLPKFTPSNLAYLLATLRQLPKSSAKTFQFNLDGKHYSQDLLTIIITKGLYAGGGMKLGSPLNHATGKFACKLIEPFYLKGLTQGLQQVYTNGISSLPFVDSLDGSQFSINSKTLMNIEIDGELYTCKHLKLSIRRSAVNMLAHPSHESRRLQLVKK